MLVMTTFYDVPPNQLLPVVADELLNIESIVAPDWAGHVKTGAHKERPPTQDNWWQVRAAAMLRKIAMLGLIGVNHLSQEYGGKGNRGASPNSAMTGSRHIVRSVLQQLEDAGLIEKDLNKIVEVEDEDGSKSKVNIYNGRKITGAGQRLLDNAAHGIRETVDANYPGMEKY